LAQDANRFVVKFDIPISASTPHIYISALPFSPADCFVAKQYRSQFSNSLSVLSGGDQNWPPLLNIFRGHTDSVYSVAFSADGKHVVSGSSDDTIRIWDAGTGELMAGPIEGHSDSVCSIAVSPDGQHVVSGSDDRTICTWDAETGQLVGRPFEGHRGYVESIALSPCGGMVVSGSDDRTVRIWDMGTGALVAAPLEGHTGCVQCVAFSPNAKRVVSCSDDSTICIWDIPNGELVVSVPKVNGSVLSVAFSPDSRHVVSCSYEAIRIWDAETGELVGGPFEGHTGYVEAVAYSPDGNRVVSGSRDRTVRIWDVGTGELVVAPFEGHTRWVWSVAYSPDGKRVVSGSADHTVRIWDAGAGWTISGLSDGRTTPVSSVTFSRDHLGVVSHSNNNIARSEDTETLQVIAFRGHSEVVLSVTSSLDGHSDPMFRDVTLRNRTTACFNTPSGFLGQQLLFDGWVRCSNLAGGDSGDRGHLFWVPETCRAALCGAETLIVAGKRTTRLDLSRFVHGTSWTQCHFRNVSTLHSCWSASV
jgi:WD40 repeat protein